MLNLNKWPASGSVWHICHVKCHLSSGKASHSEGNGVIWGGDLINLPEGRQRCGCLPFIIYWLSHSVCGSFLRHLSHGYLLYLPCCLPAYPLMPTHFPSFFYQFTFLFFIRGTLVFMGHIYWTVTHFPLFSKQKQLYFFHPFNTLKVSQSKTPTHHLRWPPGDHMCIQKRLKDTSVKKGCS